MARYPLAWALALLGIAACSTVIGIEELEPGPKPELPDGGSAGSLGASAGKGQGPGSGGTVDSLGGRSTTGGATATGGRGATATGGAAAGGTAAGGTSSTSGGSNTDAGASATGESGGESGAASGESGGAGGAASDSGTVTGTVIDFWRRPLANLPIAIGTANGVTDADGKFSIPDVTPPYDVHIRIDTGDRNYAWVYLGITQLTPTLQVESGYTTSRMASVTLYADGAEFDPEDSVGVTLGTPDGSHSGTIGSTGVNPYPSWTGPAMTSGTIHALWWARGAGAEAMDPPASYLAYATQTATLTDAGSYEFNLDLSPGLSPVSDRMVQGTVRRTIDESSANHLFLRFSSNGVIRLSRQSTDTASFAYTVPDIAASEVVVAASQGNSNNAYGLAHAVAASAAVSLAPPSPPTVIRPASDATNVGPGTEFEWTDVPGIRVLHIEDLDFYRGMYVVTTENQVTLPVVGGGFTLRTNAVHWWTVEVHGTAETMDEATGSEGFLDSFSYATEEPRGPRRGDGSYATTQRRGFTTPP